jgi:predicted RNA binding protein YcfA (HicA-like mRNA interferase family)
VTVPMHRELRPGLLRRLMRDAGISREELLGEL